MRPSGVPLAKGRNCLQPTVVLAKPLLNPAESVQAEAEPPWICFAVVVLSVLSCLPCLTFEYLPMTDLPQHEAIVSIMRHMHDPSYGFERYYDWAFDRTLYIFPYLFATALAYVVPLRWAMHVTVFLAVLSYPVGMLLTLRALRRPQALALLALPLVYSRAFFWGFINFSFGLGLAFLALSVLVGSWSRRKGWVLAGLCVLTALTHVYGLLFLFGYTACWLLFGERREVGHRLVWMVPSALGLVGWGLFAASAPGYGGTQWVPFGQRLEEMGISVLGGYADGSEGWLLCGLLTVVLILLCHAPASAHARWRDLWGYNQGVGLLIALNGVGYFVLPSETATAKFIHFRHLLMAVMALPLLVSTAAVRRTGRAVQSLPMVLALLALVNSWWHLFRFDWEARDFDAVASAVPKQANVVQLTYDSVGEVMAVPAYLHFGAYLQAQKGGAFAVSFPIVFWNIPLRGRLGSGVPESPRDLEWKPWLFEDGRWGEFYEYVLVRCRSGQPCAPQRLVPYTLVTGAENWALFRRKAQDQP